MHPNQTIAVTFIVAVHFISLALTVMALAAWRRSRDRRLFFVGAAFLAFALKSLLTAYSLWTGFLHHEDLEGVGAGFDLVIVLLLVAPFVFRSNARTKA